VLGEHPVGIAQLADDLLGGLVRRVAAKSLARLLLAARLAAP
jgi:hypothetical protein